MTDPRVPPLAAIGISHWPRRSRSSPMGSSWRPGFRMPGVPATSISPWLGTIPMVAWIQASAAGPCAPSSAAMPRASTRWWSNSTARSWPRGFRMAGVPAISISLWRVTIRTAAWIRASAAEVFAPFSAALLKAPKLWCSSPTASSWRPGSRTAEARAISISLWRVTIPTAAWTRALVAEASAPFSAAAPRARTPSWSNPTARSWPRGSPMQAAPAISTSPWYAISPMAAWIRASVSAGR